MKQDDLQGVKTELNNRIEQTAQHLLPQGKRNGTHWVCGDAEGTPGTSFKLCLEGEKRGLWHDFATGDSGDVLNLWCRSRGMGIAEALTDASSWLGVSRTPFGATSSRHSPAKKVMVRATAPDGREGEDLFVYRDALGTPVIYVKRIDQRDGSKTFRQWGRGPEGKGWVPSLQNTKKPWPLFRLNEWVCDEDETVFVHEGEKAVMAAVNAKLSGVHTTTLGGSQNPKQSELMPLYDRDVVIVPDNDDPGIKYAATLSELLQDDCTSVKVLQLPNLPPKGDVVEWLAQGGGSAAWDALTTSARKPVTKGEERRFALDAALKAVQDGDFGAHWEPRVIRAAQECFEEDKAAYHRFRAKLKVCSGHVRIAEWSKAVEGSLRSLNDDTHARQLVAYVRENAELFHDQDKVGYATFQQRDHRETWSLNSKGFSEWMGGRAFGDLEMTPGDSTISTALNTLNGLAKYGGVQYDVHMRCAKHGDGYIIDLCDERWQAVYVDATGWKVMESPPVKFIRPDNATALPVPASRMPFGATSLRHSPGGEVVEPYNKEDLASVVAGSPDPATEPDPVGVSSPNQETTRTHMNPTSENKKAFGRSNGTPNVLEERRHTETRSGSDQAPGSGDPGATSGLNALRDCINLPDEYWTMLITYMLECFRPETPYPVLELNGEQGSAKSTTHRIIRQLIDPSRIPLRAAPKELSDIFISAGNNHVVALENISVLSDKMQDALCTLATGGGFNTRQLYTNGTEFVIDVKRPVVLNGITTVVTRSDLIDRTLHFDLPRINEYRDSTIIDDFFELHRPSIFAGLLDVFSKTLAILPTVELDNPPRMVDFVRLGEAVHLALGVSDSFNEMFKANRRQSLLFSLESSPAMEDLLGIIRFRRKWEGTYKELLDHISADGKDRGIKSAKGMSNLLKRYAPAFRAQGVDVEFLGHGRNGNIVRIQAMEELTDVHNVHTHAFPFK